MAGMAPPGGGAGGAFKVGAKFMDGKYTYYFTTTQVGLELRILKSNLENLTTSVSLEIVALLGLLTAPKETCSQGCLRSFIASKAIFRNNATGAKAKSKYPYQL